MNQAHLDLDPRHADACNRTGFELGWDHAHHGLVPPPGLMLEGTPVAQGWCDGKAVFGRRTLAAPRHVRQWLALRTHAWKHGIAFEGTQVTAHYLAQIDATHCPVTRRMLGGAAGTADAPVVERLNADAGYAAGNLALLCEAASTAKAGLDAREALARAGRVDAGIEPAPEGLSPAACWRLAVLQSFVTPLPFAEAAAVPMRVLPPNRVRLLNAVQGLQALVTLQFAGSGWSQRMRELAALMPAAVQPEFRLFVGAMAPRLLEREPTRAALEDAWADLRVLRRWQQVVLALGEAGVDALIERLAEAGVAGKRTLVHAPAQATEGWSLASRGRVVSAPKAALPARPRRRGADAAAARG